MKTTKCRDHVYPQSKLPFDSLEHLNFQKCWALENLRPLSAAENFKKGNYLPLYKRDDRIEYKTGCQQS